MRKMFVYGVLMVGLMLGYSNGSLGKLKQPQPSGTITYNEYAIGDGDCAGCYNSMNDAQAAINSGKLSVNGTYSIDKNGLWKDFNSDYSFTDLSLYDQLKNLPKNKYEIIQDMEGTWHPYFVVKVK